MVKSVHIPVEKIQTEGLQTRAAIDTVIVREYAEAATAGGAVLPPIVVFCDPAGAYWLGDGFHRLAAAKQTGQKRISAEVRDGGRLDALRFALGANGTHGLRRTNADKAHAVKMAYEHRAELGLPDVPAAAYIAKVVAVDDMTATSELRRLFPAWAAATARTGADGKTRELPPVPVRRAAAGLPAPAGPPSRRQEPAAAAPALPPPPSRRPAPMAGDGTKGTSETHGTNEDGTFDGVQDGSVDGRGRHIPEDLLPIWNRRQEVQDLATAISRVRVALKKAYEGHDPLWCELNYQAVKAELDQAYHSISSAQPWCVCAMCQGIGCRACNSQGLMSEYRFEQVVPKDMRG